MLFRSSINQNTKIADIVEKNKTAIQEKVLADTIMTDQQMSISKEWNVNGQQVTIGLEKIC